MIGTLLDRRYRVVQVLATGGFGQTYIAEDTKRPGNPVCVVKHLKPASSDAKLFETAKRLFQSEAESLEKLGNHDQIPRLLAYFDDNQEFYLVQEFIEGHTLSEELVPGERWSEEQVIYLLHEVLSILEFVHTQGVIHRDIKPDNIIRRKSDNKIVLVDFGAVKQLRAASGYPGRIVGGHSMATVAIGTPGYMPTEQGQGKPRPNSDIYALGIIAIQALTGVAPMDLQEDQHTGEILWQQLVQVSPQLAAVLNKMIRYHFKDRYQNAGDALRAIQAIAPISASVPSRAYTQVSPTSALARPTSAYSRQQTLAVAPSHRQRPAASAVVVSPSTPAKQKGGRFDFLQAFILLLLAGGAAFAAPMVVKNVQGFAANWTKSDTFFAQNCQAEIGGTANIRSEPSAVNSDTILQTAAKGAKFEVTGTRSKRGWIQLRLDSGKIAWTHSSVIANNNEWATCLRDKGIATKTINDDDLIVDRPAPKPVANVTIAPQPTPANTTTPKPIGINPGDVVEEARKKYESGDFQGAIDLLRSVPQSIEDTKRTISQWQDDWTKAEQLFRDIDSAIAQGNWDKVKEYQKDPNRLPNIQYWRDKIDPLFQQAAEEISKQKLPEITFPIPEKKPTNPATKTETEKRATDNNPKDNNQKKETKPESQQNQQQENNPNSEVNRAEELLNNLFGN